MYLAAHRFHFALWRWQRISERASLAFLRRTFVETNLIEVNPSPAWVVNRNAEDYRRIVGLKHEDGLLRASLSGHVPSYRPTRILDSGSGNNTAAYELTRGGLVVAGSGHSLLFALDQTLTNYLYEPFRSGGVAGYESTALGNALKLAEIWSINRFLSPNFQTDGFDPVAALQHALSEGSIKGSSCFSASEQTKTFLDSNQPHLNGETVVTAIALGYLIDAIASRACFPNGMEFSYPELAVVMEVVPILLERLQDPKNHTTATTDLFAHKEELYVLRDRVFQHLQDPFRRPEVDTDITEFLPRVADVIKAVAFELSSKNGEPAIVETLHAIANELWRWRFFLSDLAAWNQTSEVSRRCATTASTVRAWLERPWGVLRVEDMRAALAEGFESAYGAGFPPLVVALQSLLRGGTDELIKDRFGSLVDIQSRVAWLIGQRCRLRDLRESIKVVTYEDESDEFAREKELADLLIELLTLWFYGLAEEERFKIIMDELKPLIAVMRTGSWLDDSAAQEIQLTRRQSGLLEDYQRNPNLVVAELFDFDESSGLLDRLDVFPLEEFWIDTFPT